jgi:glycerophosphoryl diester phosphodiesterase
MLEKVVIGSFYDNIVNLVNSEDPEFTTSAAAREAWTLFLLNKISLGGLHQPTGVAYQIPVSHKGMNVVTPSLVRTAHSLGQEVHVWTIDDPVEMRRLLEMDVDGIVTNRPDIALQVVEEFR